MIWAEVSAKNGYGVNEMFVKISEKIYANQMSQLN